MSEESDWMALTSAYGLPFDPRPSLAAIEAGPNNGELWHRFWGDIYHQGDVGTASYAAIPILARIAVRRSDGACVRECLTMATMVEHARPAGPPIPDWLRVSYDRAWESLPQTALTVLTERADKDLAAAALAVIAMREGLPALAWLSLMTEDERVDIQRTP